MVFSRCVVSPSSPSYFNLICSANLALNNNNKRRCGCGIWFLNKSTGWTTEVKRSPQLFGSILWGQWISAQLVMAIHPSVWTKWVSRPKDQTPTLLWDFPKQIAVTSEGMEKPPILTFLIKIKSGRGMSKDVTSAAMKCVASSSQASRNRCGQWTTSFWSFDHFISELISLVHYVLCHGRKCSFFH